MKKIIGLLAVALIAIGFLAGCGERDDEPETPKEPQPMAVMIDGVIYYNTEQTIGVARCGVMDGEITSEVEIYELPAKDDQSNFGKGYEYQLVDRHHYDIPMDNPEGWIRFCDGLCSENHSQPAENSDEDKLCGYPPVEK